MGVGGVRSKLYRFCQGLYITPTRKHGHLRSPNYDLLFFPRVETNTRSMCISVATRTLWNLHPEVKSERFNNSYFSASPDESVKSLKKHLFSFGLPSISPQQLD